MSKGVGADNWLRLKDSLRLLGSMIALVGISLLTGSQIAEAHDGEDHGAGGGFQVTPVFAGLSEPTSVEFSPDGRAYVAEKSGVIKVFDGMEDTEPAIFADLSRQVHSYYDRGLIGMTLHPDFPEVPRVYVLYTYDAPIGGQAPVWNDCERAEDQDNSNCVVSSRLSVLEAHEDKTAGEQSVGQEKVLLSGWCQKYPSHSAGDVAFGADGALYVSGGDGADFNRVDFGQADAGACGDPSGEGGAVRAQDLQTTGDPVGLSGTLLRLDPDTGEAVPDNPRYKAPDDNESRIIAYGFRNPFRFAIEPGTSEVWQGDVGWGEWEEINNIPVSRKSGSVFGDVPNFGWPCYEGNFRQVGYESSDISVCRDLYGKAPDAISRPYFSWRHCDPVFGITKCLSQGVSSSMSGLDFYTGEAYPDEYRNALFFADGPRGKLWAMLKKSDGELDTENVETILDDTDGYVVDVKNGPNGEIYLVQVYSGNDYGPGRVVRLTRGPSATIRADRVSGSSPLEVAFDASESHDPLGRELAYRWDLDGDGQFDDATSSYAEYTFTGDQNRTVSVEVTNSEGQSAVGNITIYPDNTPPRPTIRHIGIPIRDGGGEIVGWKPGAGEGWAVGEEIAFNGYAEDAEDADTVSSVEGGEPKEILPTDRISWDTALYHCYTVEDCHRHPLNGFGVGAGGGGIITTPDHGYPAFIEFTITATDSRGLEASSTIRRDPRTIDLSVSTSPAGIPITFGTNGSSSGTREVIVGSTNSVSVPASSVVNGTPVTFLGWSDGFSSRVREIVAPESDATFTANYAGTGAPDTRITSGPAAFTAERTASFSFNSPASGVSFECSLDNVAFTNCASPRKYSKLSVGEHVFRVRAKNGSGNSDPTPASRIWTVDFLKPAVSLLQPTSGTLRAGKSAVVRVTDNSGSLPRSGIKVSIDGVPRNFSYDPDTGRVEVSSSGLSFAWHTLRVSATDAAGNVATASWRVRVTG